MNSMFKLAKKTLCHLHVQSTCRVLQAARYARGARGHYDKLKITASEDYLLKPPANSPLGMDIEDMEESLKSITGMRRHKTNVYRDPEAQRKKIKFKIIEKKYFKKPQELNLLTWDAKEQMRYLNREYPEDWTIDRLAESFPVSREGVIKILNSTFVPSTMDELIRHDERVRKNWLALKSGETGEEGGPLANRYQELLESGKLYLLEHAGGNKALPAPTSKKLQLPAYKFKHERGIPAEKNSFVALVKDYCDKKKEEEHVRTVTDGERLKLLEGNTAENENAIQIIKSDKTLRRTSRKSFKFTDSAVQEPQTVKANESERLQTLFDRHYEKSIRASSELDDSEAAVSSRGKRQPRLLRKTVGKSNEGEDSASNMADYGFVGTEKLAHNSEYSTQSREMSDDEHTSRGRKYRPSHSMFQYEKTVNEEGDELEVPFIYDEVKGYQHPLCDKYNLPDSKIRLPKHSDIDDTTYRKGNDYYDSDGNFLFRVP